jgi:hypothetical protein
MKPELSKRVKKVQEEARLRLAKRGVMRFRCTEDDILRLNEFAFTAGMPVGALIRNWVIERLDQEEQSSSSELQFKQPKLTTLKTEIRKELNNFDKRLKIVEKLIRQTL